MTRTIDTQSRTDTETTTDTANRYTDAENTGTAAVPDLRTDGDRGDERDDLDELVWSHRL